MERVANLSGASVAYELSGDGPPLVWCHGLASCREGDRDYIDAFARHFTVLSYDARGHGRSEPVHEPERFTYPALSQDLIELLDLVGWRSAMLAGSSMGAGTVIRVALLQPARAKAVVMLRPGSGGGAAPDHLQILFRMGAAAIRTGGLDAAIDFLLTIPEARDAIEKDPGRIDGLRRDWGRHDPRSIAAALEGIPSSAPLTPDLDLQVLTAPVLVVPGSDAIHPTEAGREAARILPGAVALDPFDAPSREVETSMLVETLVRFANERAQRRSSPSPTSTT